jgi:hypothetical protein
VNVVTSAPAALVVNVTPPEQIVFVAWRHTVYTVDGAYPDPVMLTSVPTLPVDSAKFRVAVVTLKEVFATLGGLADTWSTPIAARTIVIKHDEKLPVGSAMHVPPTVPPGIAKKTVPGANPVPDAVTTVPCGP